MKLPNYPYQSTVTELQSTTTGSSSLIVQTSVSPTVPAVTCHTRRRRLIEAQKSVSFPVVVRGQDGVPSGHGRSESDECELRNKIQVVAWLEIRWDRRRQKRVEPRLFEIQTAAFQSVFNGEDGEDVTGVS